jgi:hypothetical protein
MVHGQKYKLSELAKIAEDVMWEKIEIIIDNNDGLCYTGNADKLKSYDFLQFDEIDIELAMYFEELNI